MSIKPSKTNTNVRCINNQIRFTKDNCLNGVSWFTGININAIPRSDIAIPISPSIKRKYMAMVLNITYINQLNQSVSFCPEVLALLVIIMFILPISNLSFVIITATKKINCLFSGNGPSNWMQLFNLNIYLPLMLRHPAHYFLHDSYFAP